MGQLKENIKKVKVKTEYISVTADVEKMFEKFSAEKLFQELKKVLHDSENINCLGSYDLSTVYNSITKILKNLHS